jgi:cell division protein FtsQ
MGGDIGRNIFFVPLAQRKAQLEQIPWVESASVMRFVPNRLKVEIHERSPVAFARVGTKIMLTDAAGTLMDLPGRKKYSFPVIVGMNNGEPPSTRAARMKIYNDVVGQLDAGGARYSQELSEIDLSDPDDVKVLANHHAGEVLVHLGSSNYLERYKIYVTHLQEWQQQFDKLESVDLRYDRQIIVNPDLQGPMKQPPLSAEAAKKAMAAGVKPAALITRLPTVPRPSPTLAVKTVGPAPAKPTPTKPAASIKTVKAGHHKPRVRWARSSAKGRAKAKPGVAVAAKTQPKPALKSVATVKPAAKPSPAIAKGETQ